MRYKTSHELLLCDNLGNDLSEETNGFLIIPKIHIVSVIFDTQFGRPLKCVNVLHKNIFNIKICNLCLFQIPLE